MHPKQEAPRGFVVLSGGAINLAALEYFLEEMIRGDDNDLFVVVLSSSEPSNEIRRLLAGPMYKGRAKYIMGSSLSVRDMKRARVREAKGVFIVCERYIMRNADADRRTLLRYWSLRDYAPHLHIYVQLMLLENVKHLDLTSGLTSYVCIDELRFAMTAHNCICPGVSTLIAHMMRGSKEDQALMDMLKHVHNDDMLTTYLACLSNSLTSAKAATHHYFKRFLGRQFRSLMSLCAKESICLIGILSKEEEKVLLNPSGDYYLNGEDIVYFIVSSDWDASPQKLSPHLSHSLPAFKSAKSLPPMAPDQPNIENAAGDVVPPAALRHARVYRRKSLTMNKRHRSAHGRPTVLRDGGTMADTTNSGYSSAPNAGSSAHLNVPTGVPVTLADLKVEKSHESPPSSNIASTLNIAALGSMQDVGTGLESAATSEAGEPRIFQVITKRKLDKHVVFNGSESFMCHVLVHYELFPDHARQLQHVLRADLHLAPPHLAKDNFIIVREREREKERERCINKKGNISP